ncbi:hypothetical protein [Agromyces arachidis]|uniref:hypothetical protein n=1 Tax=Agromyces arachidis TaxID=766966 RepID=UPI004055E418
MEVHVLHIEGCPHRAEAGAGARQALDAVGLADVPVDYVVVRSASQAARAGFAGSPTITVDGEDLFPTPGRTGVLACRVYATGSGPARAPTREQIEHALRARGRR